MTPRPPAKKKRPRKPSRISLGGYCMCWTPKEIRDLDPRHKINPRHK